MVGITVITKKMYVLPKPYLSYSAISLWEKSKDQFRKRYYESELSVDTPETRFGKKIGKLLEAGGDFGGLDILRKIPRYSHPEYKIEAVVGEVPIMGYLDSFDPLTRSILEYKTGRGRPDGKPRWTQVDVQRTDQLPMYSLLAKEKFGSVDPITTLVWMETRYKKEAADFEGHTLEAASNEIEFTGRAPVIFERRIFEYERKALKDKIIRVAKEIHDDYEGYRKQKADLEPLQGSTEEVMAIV